MSWSIANIINTVEVNDKIAQELFKKVKGVWYSVEDIKDGEKLYFDTDHMEHMDYVSNKKVIEILKKHKVKGMITFGSLEGDNRGDFWGYEFDGEGNMTELTGNIQWSAVVPKPKKTKIK